MTTQKELAIYQVKNGAIRLRADAKKETLWATQRQMAGVFGVDVRTINEHIKNIYKTGELKENATIRKFQIVQKEGRRMVEREVAHYNLDLVISVGYRVNSKTATAFRQWATKTLHTYITDGFVIDKRRVKQNHKKFLTAVADVKALLPAGKQVSAVDALELTKLFADTWLSIDAYDRDTLPTKGASKKKARITADELSAAISGLKGELIRKKEATELFAQERGCGSVEGIVGNVFQSAFGKMLQPAGHCEVEDASLVACAMREVREETGLDVRLHPWHAARGGIPLDVDSHAIPPRPEKGEGVHMHHDFLFVFELSDAAQEIVLQEEEVGGAHWVDVDDITEPRLVRVVEKLHAFDLI